MIIIIIIVDNNNKYQMIKGMGFVYLMPCNIPIKARICF